MAETAWETKANCAVPCELPNVCWEPCFIPAPTFAFLLVPIPTLLKTTFHCMPFLSFGFSLLLLLADFCFGVVLTVSSGIYKCLTRRRCKNTAEISRPANRSTRRTRGFDPLPVPFTSAV
ncbi:hypothetical protein niasHT_025585 [Heterodera trifolii]|uniref:Uncharacterized protein n=1 Tax=Heterodera trifolii TaxID=157864 RepID=A0ABD2K099_9BILA